jgi:5-methylcytosine-specific restriction protein A
MIKLIKHAYNLLRSQVRDVGIPEKRSSHWPTVQKDFLSKNPVCAICGASDKLNVHHKKPFHLHPELELDETNLITLCMSAKECHLMIGHGDNFKAYNPNIEPDAVTLHKDISKFNLVAAEAKTNRLFE